MASHYYDRDAPPKNSGVLRVNRFTHRRNVGMPYVRIDRDGDAQMGEGSAGNFFVGAVDARAPYPGRGGGHAPRSRSSSVAASGPGRSTRLERGPRGSWPRGVRGRDRAKTFERRQNQPSWHKVRLIGAAQVDRTWLLKRLNEDLSIHDIQLNPIQIGIEGNSLVFHVNDAKAAIRIKELHRTILFPHGGKLPIQVTESQQPPMQLDEGVKELIKTAMSRRYDAATQSLSLNGFNESPEFKAAGLSIQLSRTSYMRAVIDLIQANIQNLRSLDMSRNRLTQLVDLAVLAGKVPVRQLILSDNEIRQVHEIEKLRHFGTLEDLDLSRNPVSTNYPDTPAYVEALRKKLPTLLRLDGVELPRKIGFDAPVRATLPVPTPFHAPNEEAKKQLSTFVQQFFSCYDSQRSMLTAAYADDAQFSLQISRIPDRPSEYYSVSRNLTRVFDNTQKTQRLFLGRTAIVNFFATLPATQHILDAFTMDVFFNEHALVGFTVVGVFRDGINSVQNKRGTMKAFSRNFMVKIRGEGLSILSDTLTLSSPSVEQINQFDQIITALPSVSGTPASQPVTSTTPPENVIDDQLKAKMVASFCGQSGMNEKFSRMALEDNGWDYVKAGTVFTQLHSANRIPPEAFLK